MNANRKLLTSCAIALLLVSTFPIMRINHAVEGQPIGASLTGIIFDHGVDTNGNGLYDFLEIDVQINVNESGDYRVSIYELTDQSYAYLYISNSTQGYLDIGTQYLNVSLYGPAIYGRHFNPQRVYSIELDTADYWYIGSIYDVGLSKTYYYYEFDPHISMTGDVTDRGIDTDGDVLFNYLEVGVELNVTKPGTYQLYVQGLAEREGNATNYMYEYHSFQENFTVGAHLVYMNFSGPAIVYYHISPTDIYSLSLYEFYSGIQVEYVDFKPLSKQYASTLFDAPSNEMQFNFNIYPDATIEVNGTANARHVYPENTGTRINATLDISTLGDVTLGSANGTIEFPKSSYWTPFDSSQAHFNAVYDQGIFDADLNIAMALPPEATGMYPYNTTDGNLYAHYIGGVVDMTVTGQTVLPRSTGTFPSNISDISDVILRADYSGTQLVGNITFHTFGGFPLADIVVDFEGDRSVMSFTGNVNVTYGTYINSQINETVLDQMISQMTTNFTGQGPYSLYNATAGFFECTQLNITKNPWPNPTLGTDLEYNANIKGNLTGLIAYLMYPPGSPSDDLQQPAYAALESAVDSVGSGSLTLNYYHTSRIATLNAYIKSDVKTLWNNILNLVPGTLGTMSPEQKTQVETWLRIGNATAYALTEATVNASYSSAEKKVALQASLEADITKLKEDVAPILPDGVPLEIHDFVNSFFNTTYCNLTRSTTSFNLMNGIGTFDFAVTLNGNFKAELNHIKTIYIDAMNSSSSMLPWQFRLLNATDVDVNNFHADFRIGNDWTSMSFDGLVIKPQPNIADPIRFRLYSWLNMTSDPYAPPREFENLKITISGAADANQVVLLYQPFDVPNPDTCALDYRTMTWNNVSLSSLKDLMFLVAYEGKIDYSSKTYSVPVFTNSTVSNFGFESTDKQIHFNVTGSTGTGFCNVTIPRNILDAPSLSDWVITFDGTILTPEQFEITQNAQFVFVYLNYTHSEHQIGIAGTVLVGEYQPIILQLIFILSIAAAGIIAFKERKRLKRLAQASTLIRAFRQRAA